MRDDSEGLRPRSTEAVYLKSLHHPFIARGSSARSAPFGQVVTP